MVVLSTDKLFTEEGGGLNPIDAVSRAVTAVKGSSYFLGVNQTVEQCSGALCPTLLVNERHG